MTWKSVLLVALALSSLSPSANSEEIIAPYAISISGGVSLGNYEAGMNWAIVNILKKYNEVCLAGQSVELCDTLKSMLGQTGAGRIVVPQLVTVTGASAGAVNTLATALEWCKRDRSDAADNLFRDVWIKLDIANLLPANQKRYVNGASHSAGLPEKDGLFARHYAFQKGFKRLREEFEAKNFRPGCRLNLAVTLTRTTAARLEVIKGMEVDNSRFVVPLRFETCSTASDGAACGAMVTPNLDMEGNALLGNIIYPPVGRDNTVSFDDLFRIITASSAFPVAFGRVELNYCIAARYAGGANNRSTVTDDKHCASGYTRETAYFIDGGVFDNVPLGAARILTEYQSGSSPARTTEFRYIYMDPDNQRQTATRNDAANTGLKTEGHSTFSFSDYLSRNYADCFTLLCQLAFAQDAFKSARQYELYTELRLGYWGETSGEKDRNLNQRSSSQCNLSRSGCRRRELLITSRFPHLTGGFLGAFGAFLNYEFRHYDYYAGIYDASVNIASHLCGTKADGRDKCTAELSANVAGWLLNADDSPDGWWLLQSLHELEFSDAPFKTRQVNNSFRSVAVAIELEHRRGGSFGGFIDLLRDGDPGYGFTSHFDVPDKDGVFADIWNERYSQWWIPLAKSTIPRLRSLEKTGDASALALINAAGFGLETLYPEKPNRRFVFSKATNDNALFDLLPYQVEANLDGSGWGVSWEPTLRFKRHSRFHIDFKIMPWNYSKVGDERTGFAEFTPYLAYGFGEADLHHFGFGFSRTYTYDKWENYDRTTTGISLYYEFARKIRLTIGKRSLNDRFAGDNIYLSLGFTDLPGWAYWLSR